MDAHTYACMNKVLFINHKIHIQIKKNYKLSFRNKLTTFFNNMI